MTRQLFAGAVVIACLAILPPPAEAQGVAAAAAELMTPLPPATKLEAFTPSTSLVTLGYDDLGTVTGPTGEGRIAVDVREVRDARGVFVRGVVVEVTEGKDRTDRSFIDEDEVPALVAGIDALLNVRTNPTPFKKFEATYRTRGEFEVTALNTVREDILYSVTAGRAQKVQVSPLRLADLQKLKAMFEAAEQKLAWLANGR